MAPDTQSTLNRFRFKKEENRGINFTFFFLFGSDLGPASIDTLMTRKGKKNYWCGSVYQGSCKQHETHISERAHRG